MSNTLHRSHELSASDLLQVRLDDLPLDELEAHIKEADDTVLGLVSRLNNTPHLSPTAAANLRRLERALRERIQFVRELIDLRKLEALAEEIERQEREQQAEGRASVPRGMRC